ncbi:O-antigen ligase family protein [Thermodesulfobacteriota bacterium]
MEKAAFGIYLFVLIFSPLAFGAVHTYAYTIMSIGVLIGTLLLLKKNIKKDPKSGLYQVRLPATSLNFLFLSLLAYLIFQIILLPEALLDFLSPEALVVHKKSLPSVSIANSMHQIIGWFPIAPYSHPVRMSIIRWTVYGLFFLGLSRVLNSRKRIELTIMVVLIIGCFEALYGLIQTYSGSHHIWWVYKQGLNKAAVSGTYFNKNYFAGLMEMCLMLAAAYAACISVRRRERKILSGHKSSLRAGFNRLLSMEQRFNKRLFVLFGGAVIGIGLVFSASRGGMIGAAGGLLCMALFFLLRKQHRRRGYVVLIIFLITVSYALHIGAEYSLERFKSAFTSMEVRTRWTQKTVDLFRAYKLTGVGVGNFPHAYPLYQAPEDKLLFITHATNDWAEFLADAGIFGFSLFCAGVVYFFYQSTKLWRKRKDPFAICVGIAPFAAMTAIGIHSWADYNLHIPANFLMLTAITAIGYSALHLEKRRNRERTLVRYHVMPLKWRGIIILILVLGTISWSGVWVIRHFVAEAYCMTVPNRTLNRDNRPPLEEIRKAIRWDGGNAKYWWKLARELIKIQDTGYRMQVEGIGIQDAGTRMQGEGIGIQDTGDKMQDEGYRIPDREEVQREIIKALEKAVRLNPFEVDYHMELGWKYLQLAHWKVSEQKWFRAADISMERAAYFVKKGNPYQHIILGDYWIIRSKMTHPADPEWEVFWSKARWHYRKNLSMESDSKRKERIKHIRGTIWSHYPDESFVEKVLEESRAE